MKAFKHLIALLAALALCLMPGLSAFADDGAETAGAQDWDTLMERLVADYQVEPSYIAAGYRNLVTGEEHLYNGDTSFEAASMYMVPLCMYYAEHIASGELNFGDYAYLGDYENVQDSILQRSNDTLTAQLNTILGGLHGSHVKTAPYMGIDRETAANSDYLSNYYTPGQFLDCLELLYGESERFPGVIEDMQQCSRERFFLLYERRFNIAHRYGDYKDMFSGGPHFMNDCAICFTEEPIAIVLFTRAVHDAEHFMTAFCTAMCEYAERNAKRVVETPEPTPIPTPRATSFPAAAERTADDDGTAPLPFLLPLGLTAAFLIAGLLIALRTNRRMKTRSPLLILAVLLSAAAMLLSAVGLREGTVVAILDSDPAQTAEAFFDALEAGDYAAAYRQLGDYADLGLGGDPGSEAGRIMADALHRSYSHTLLGPCEIEKLTARQPVRLVFLNLPSMEEAVEEQTKLQLDEFVRTRPVSEVYDEEQRMLPAVTEEAYLAALHRVLEGAEGYYSYVDLELDMNYSDGRWQIRTSPGLLGALNGGAGY